MAVRKHSKYADLSISELAAMGGKAKKRKYGKRAFTEMARKGAQATLERHGPEHYHKMAAAELAAHTPEDRRERQLAWRQRGYDRYGPDYLAWLTTRTLRARRLAYEARKAAREAAAREAAEKLLREEAWGD